MNDQITDVIFLGAGASKSEGTPLQSDLFGDYFKKPKKTYSNIKLVSFFNDFFGIDVNSSPSNDQFPTFEEVLGVLDLAIGRDECFRGYHIKPDEPLIQQIREEVILLIAKILSQRLKGKGKAGYHYQLLTTLIKKNKIKQTAFISLNYDILIDNALTGLYPNYDLDYCIHFTNFDRKRDWRPPRLGKSINLCKLHGSLNWLYCPTCISLTLTPKRNGAATTIIKRQKCKTCKTITIPILIPPTFFKVMSNIYLQQIWNKTDQILTNASRIYFCGYSFPDADIHIKYLLKRAEMNRIKPLKIYVINNYKDKDPDISAIEEKRYRRFFRKNTEVFYSDKSFQEFCSEGLFYR